jgi:cytochrome c
MPWKAIGIGGLFLVASCMAFSFVHPWGDLRSVAPGGQILEAGAAPDEVRRVLEKKCADCHSNQTHWPVYSRVAPISWLIERDVHTGRSAMNLSLWAGMGVDDRIAMLTRIAAEVRSGEMPPKPYTLAHPANRLTESDKQEIAAWARAERKRVRTESTERKERENP